MKFNNTEICEKNLIWYVDRSNNCVISIDSENKKIIYGKIPFEGKYSGCIVYEKKVFCFPAMENTNIIAIFDIQKQEFRKIEIGCERDVNIIDHWITHDFIWMISQGNKSIIKLNIEFECVEKEYFVLGDETFLGTASDMVGKNIYVVSQEDLNIYVFNIMTEEISCLKVETKEKGYNTVSVINDFIFLTGENNCIYKYNIEKRTIDVINFDQNKFQKYSEGPCFVHAKKAFGKIYYTPFTGPERANAIIIYNPVDDDLVYIDVLKDVFCKCVSFGNRYVDIIKIEDEENLDINMGCLPLHRYNVKKGNVEIRKTRDIQINNSFWEKVYEISEEDGVTLETFLHYLKSNI